MSIPRRVSAALIPFVLGAVLVAVSFAPTHAQAPDSHSIYLPLVSSRWSLIPDKPTARVTNLADGDNAYDVVWTRTDEKAIYTVQEATSQTFAGARVVASGRVGVFARSVARPGRYYYRLQAANGWGPSPWSDPVVAEVPSLFIGLALRWDELDEKGTQGDTVVTGAHQERMVTGNFNPSIAEVSNRTWYDPNPSGRQTKVWFTTYDKASLTLVGISEPISPFVKWEFPWIMPSAVTLQSGAQVEVDGHPFDVSRREIYSSLPDHNIAAWKLTNRDAIIAYEDDQGIQTRMGPNDAVLWYAADASRLLLHYEERLTYYVNGARADMTETHSGRLMIANAFGEPTNTAETRAAPPPR